MAGFGWSCWCRCCRRVDGRYRTRPSQHPLPQSRRARWKERKRCLRSATRRSRSAPGSSRCTLHAPTPSSLAGQHQLAFVQRIFGSGQCQQTQQCDAGSRDERRQSTSQVFLRSAHCPHVRIEKDGRGIEAGLRGPCSSGRNRRTDH
jgi:hypothetical protein